MHTIFVRRQGLLPLSMLPFLYFWSWSPCQKLYLNFCFLLCVNIDRLPCRETNEKSWLTDYLDFLNRLDYLNSVFDFLDYGASEHIVSGILDFQIGNGSRLEIG